MVGPFIARIANLDRPSALIQVNWLRAKAAGGAMNSKGALRNQDLYLRTLYVGTLTLRIVRFSRRLLGISSQVAERLSLYEVGVPTECRCPSGA